MRYGIAFVVLLSFGVAILAVAGDKPATETKAAQADAGKAAWAPAVKPKPLSENVERGLDWLVKHQFPDGAWGQGEESAQMGGGAEMKDVGSVADTAIAAMALVRSGNTPKQGEYADAVRKAVEFVCAEIERSDADSLYVTDVRGTRVQSKLGPYIDTFLANLLLAEVHHHMPDQKSEKRVSAALDKVLAKIQKNQRADGTWGNEGWAPTIAQGLAAKGLNRAAQGGKAVSPQVRERAEKYSQSQYDSRSGKFGAEGSAGVELYSASSALGGLADSVNTNAQMEAEFRQQAQSAPSAPERQQAQATLRRFDEAKRDLKAAQEAVVARLDDKDFIAGFGSNGGEEFLSYMNIGESLVVKGGDEWKAWDKSITENLNRVQNSDGSWTGHHCITGRTFCTSSALLVLMVDRTPVPIAAKIGRR